MAKELDHLACRNQTVFSTMTAEEWRAYAGQVLAIDPRSDQILSVGKSEEELEKQSFDCDVVEYFHVPEAGSLKSAR